MAKEDSNLKIGYGAGGCLREQVVRGANPDNPNIHYKVGNAETSSFENNCFDIVVIATSLASILDPEMKACGGQKAGFA